MTIGGNVRLSLLVSAAMSAIGKQVAPGLDNLDSIFH